RRERAPGGVAPRGRLPARVDPCGHAARWPADPGRGDRRVAGARRAAARAAGTVTASAMESRQSVLGVRHGETDWSAALRHTGLTDVPLNASGERAGRALGACLREWTFARAFVSPLQRARRTCELAGFGDVVEVRDDLREWDYGEYEGR